MAEPWSGTRNEKRLTWQKDRSDHVDDLGDEASCANMRMVLRNHLESHVDITTSVTIGIMAVKTTTQRGPIAHESSHSRFSSNSLLVARASASQRTDHFAPFFVQRKTVCQVRRQQDSRKFPARTNKRTIRRANRLDETRALNLAPPRFLPGVRVVLFFQLLFFSPAPTTG